MKAQSDPSLDEIEIEIARTRVRLADTADTLAVELAPSRLAREGVEMLNEFFGRPDAIKFAGLRADPVALGLLGLGVAWLAAENLGLLDGVIPGIGKEPSSTADSTREPIASAGIARDEADKTGGWFHQAANATQGALRSVYDRGGAAIGHASDLIAQQAPSGHKVRQAISSGPWLLGLGGLAAGLALAMLLPASRPEREIVTQAREEMRETAEELGERAAATVREMADDLKAGLQGDRSGERGRREYQG
jgi:Protein of unknown function (DUF3618)